MRKILYPNLALEMMKNGDLQEDLAKKLGISVGTTCRKLSGKNEWKISEIIKLCKIYNKDFEELFRINN